MASPIPLPRASVACRREKKICSPQGTSGGIHPLLVGDSRRSVYEHLTCGFTLSCPPEGMAWQPLRTRFRSTCFMRSRSTLIVRQGSLVIEDELETLFFSACGSASRKTSRTRPPRGWGPDGSRTERRLKSRKVFTTRSSAGSLWRVSPDAGQPLSPCSVSLDFRISTWRTMALSGFFHLMRNSGSEPGREPPAS